MMKAVLFTTLLRLVSFTVCHVFSCSSSDLFCSLMTANASLPVCPFRLCAGAVASFCLPETCPNRLMCNYMSESLFPLCYVFFVWSFLLFVDRQRIVTRTAFRLCAGAVALFCLPKTCPTWLMCDYMSELLLPLCYVSSSCSSSWFFCASRTATYRDPNDVFAYVPGAPVRPQKDVLYCCLFNGHNKSSQTHCIYIICPLHCSSYLEA